MALSLLLHALALPAIQLLLQQHNKSQPVANTLFVRLVAAPSAKPPAKPVRKLLTIPAPSTTTVTQVPLPNPARNSENMPDTQSEPITGIAMPGSVSGPFSGLHTTGPAFMHNRNAEQNSMRAYQEHVIAIQTQQQAEKDAYFLTLQLQQMLEGIFLEVSIEGKCFLNTENGKFSCSATDLSAEILKHEKTVADLFLRLHTLGRYVSGFNIHITSNKTNIILTNEHSLTNSNKQ